MEDNINEVLPHELVSIIINTKYAALNRLVCKHWASLIGPDAPKHDVVVIAVHTGKLNILQYLYDTGAKVFDDTRWMFINAAMRGHVHVLKWLRNISDTVVENIWVHAILSDRMNVFEWAWDDAPSHYNRSQFSVLAAEFGRLDMVQFACSKGINPIERTYASAAVCGHERVVEWLMESIDKFGVNIETIRQMLTGVGYTSRPLKLINKYAKN